MQRDRLMKNLSEKPDSARSPPQMEMESRTTPMKRQDSNPRSHEALSQSRSEMRLDRDERLSQSPSIVEAVPITINTSMRQLHKDLTD